MVSTFQWIKENLGDFLFGLVIIFFPVSIGIANVFVVLLIFWWIFSWRPATFRERLSTNKNAILVCIAPMLYMIFSLSYTSDLKSGIHVTEKGLLLLIFPILICTASFKRSSDFFLQLFACVISFMCVVSLSAGMYRFLFLDPAGLPMVGDYFTSVPTRWNALTSTNLTTPFTINPIYFSLYVTFAMIIVLYKMRIRTQYRTALFALLLVFQILLGSRIGLAAMLIVALAGIYFMPRGSRRYYVAALVAAVVTVSVTFMANPVLQKRYGSELVMWKVPVDLSGWNAISLRNAVWTCSAKVFLRSPVWGYGVGAAAVHREACYRDYTFYGAFGTDFNSHNQYLEYALSGGILLVGLFLFLLGYSFRRAWLEKNAVYLLFLVTFAVVAFGESLLEAHKGIVFFSCFNSMFIFKPEIPIGHA